MVQVGSKDQNVLLFLGESISPVAGETTCNYTVPGLNHVSRQLDIFRENKKSHKIDATARNFKQMNEANEENRAGSVTPIHLDPPSRPLWGLGWCCVCLVPFALLQYRVDKKFKQKAQSKD